MFFSYVLVTPEWIRVQDCGQDLSCSIPAAILDFLSKLPGNIDERHQQCSDPVEDWSLMWGVSSHAGMHDRRIIPIENWVLEKDNS